ncbi:MAG: sigma-E factor negative regulatory protein [Nitrosomonas sp.]|nr:sigma-E factor negative regulatory protein [Nitrosomonas sp.]
MKNEVSTLVDGELEKQEADKIIAALKKQEDLHEDWQTYHLIGDALRQSTKLATNIAPRVKAQLESEVTILAPAANNSKYSRNKVFAYSIAASIIAMFTAWFGLQYSYEPQQTFVADQSTIESNRLTSPIMVSTPPSNLIYQHPPVEINDYLFVHREFSPGTMTRGHTSYMHPVVDSHERFGGR